jgi:hypothetical protein
VTNINCGGDIDAFATVTMFQGAKRHARTGVREPLAHECGDRRRTGGRIIGDDARQPSTPMQSRQPAHTITASGQTRPNKIYYIKLPRFEYITDFYEKYHA